MLHYAYSAIDVWIVKYNRCRNWEARVVSGIGSGPQGEMLKADLFGNSLERKRWLKEKPKDTFQACTTFFLLLYLEAWIS